MLTKQQSTIADDNDDELHEIRSVMQLEEQFDFKNKTTQQIIWILDDSLYERQKKTINELSELDQEILKINKSLDQLDRTYSEFQGFIDAHTLHIGSLTRETQTIETYNEVLERRVNNQMKLYETLKIMLQGVELTSEERMTLTQPNFETEEGINSCEAILEKISKFLKFSNEKSNNIRAVREQLNKIQDNLTSFVNKFKENLRKQSKKLFILSQKQIQSDDSDDGGGKKFKFDLADTQSYRKLLMQYRRVISFLIDCMVQEGQDKTIINEIGTNFQYFVVNSANALDTAWNANMSSFILFKNNINFQNAGDKITLNQDDNSFILLIRDMKKFGFIELLSQLFEQTRSQVALDSRYWDKYMKFNKDEDQQQMQKLIKYFQRQQRESLVQQFLNKAYSPLYKKESDLLQGACQHSQLIGYLIEQAITKEEEEKQTENSSFNVFIMQIKQNIEAVRKESIKQQEQYLKSLDVSTRHCGVLQPIKHFVICVKLLSNFTSDKNSFYRDVGFIHGKTVEWLKSQATKKPKYNDIVMLTNLNYIVSNLDRINIIIIRDIIAKSNQSYRKFSMDYCSYLFCFQYMKFCDQWFKIKELKPSELEHQNFNKSSFLKLISSSFSGFNKTLELIIKRMSKHLVKDQDLIKKQLKIFGEYISEEYGEIETFCLRALGSKPQPTKQQLLDIINSKIV